jgi:hypothetical protein
VTHKEYESERKMVSGKFYTQVLERLLKQVFIVGPQLDDSVTTHSAVIMKDLLADCSVVEINHLPSSPYLTPGSFLYSLK